MFAPGDHLLADQLIERVVTSDIFTEIEQRAIYVEQTCAMQPAGLLEDGLRLPQALRQHTDDGRVDDEVVSQRRARLHLQRLERRFAADSAA